MRYQINILLILISIFIQCCIENTIDSVQSSAFENTALLLREIESNGDYTNSSKFPAFINSSELNNNISDYIILDVRSKQEFESGHLSNAVNISNRDLYNYVINSIPTNKSIVIISGTGQASSYYTSLFRILGINNIFSLKFGMASWNKDFSHLYTDYFGSLSNIENYHNFNNPKPNFSHLPALEKESNISTNEFLTQRIKMLIDDGFDESNSSYSNTINTIDKEYFESTLNLDYSEYFLICFGNDDLYYLGQLGIDDNPGHPKNAVLYNAFYPIAELSSVSFLQTVPPSKSIILYSFSGELSAMETAYLRLLGYNAKSLLLGYHCLDYQRLISSEALRTFAYQANLILDLPYVK